MNKLIANIDNHQRERGLVHRTHQLIRRTLFGAITHVKTDHAVVALTFDDGPDPAATPRLLKILNAHGAKATFFMVGNRAKRYPNIVKRVSRDRHAVGNHTHNHASFPLLSVNQCMVEIASCKKAIAPYGARLFRPPFGHLNLASRMMVRLLGYKIITWSIVAEDWLDHEATRIADRLVERVYPGSIILLHDRLYHVDRYSHADREAMLKAVDLFIGRLATQFRFVTVPELLMYGTPQRRDWNQRVDPEWSKTIEENQF